MSCDIDFELRLSRALLQSDLLRICTESEPLREALPYLPWRFFLYFREWRLQTSFVATAKLIDCLCRYAGVFLLKAVFVGAVSASERIKVVRLVKGLIVCLARSSSDKQHPGVRLCATIEWITEIIQSR